MSPVSPSYLRQLHWMQREWAHRFAVTGKQLFWDLKHFPLRVLISVVRAGYKSVFLVHLRRQVFLLLCSPVHCFSPSLGRLKHRSASLLSGGEQGRDSVQATQLDWVVWEVWVVLLSCVSYTAFFISLGIFQLNHSLFSTLEFETKNVSFLSHRDGKTWQNGICMIQTANTW